MGLLTGLLTLPLAPVRFVDWLAEQVVDEAEREANDTTRIQAELRALVRAVDAGLISEEEFEQAEEHLLDQLERAGYRTRGAPVSRQPAHGEEDE